MRINLIYSPTDTGLFKEGRRYQQGMLLEGQYETSQTTISRLRLELAKKGLHAQIRPLPPLTDNDGDPDQVLLQEEDFMSYTMLVIISKEIENLLDTQGVLLIDLENLHLP